MIVESLTANATTIGLGGITGFLLGYALKKIAKILVVIIGVFFAAVLYFESNGIINVIWDKLQGIAQSTVSYLTGLITTTTGTGNNSSVLLPITSLGLPLTGSAAGFAIGFMRG